MSGMSYGMRLMARLTGIDSILIKNNDLTTFQRDIINRDFNKYAEDLKRIFIESTPGISVEKVRSTARHYKTVHGVGLIIIDYLGLMAKDRFGANRNRSDAAIIGDQTASLKQLAVELDIPIILLSQLSRDITRRENKRPVLSDLRDSGCLEQDADLVIFIHRPGAFDESVDKGQGELIVAKHRNGALGVIEIGIDLTTGNFGALDKEHEEPGLPY
jgi:replicative DNA helicase